MPAYWVARSKINDPVEYKKYTDLVPAILAKYGGKVDFVRRYWTSAFTADCTDVFVMECDDLMDAHNMVQEMNTLMAQGGDPERFGETVSIWVGVNPDAG
jgi:uncharacterized protein (DUF1330 family)